MNIQPNELGQLYAGVLYIREQPGWHKRWFILTESCMQCYKYKSDEKMLFEIPLRDAKFVWTDRKRSRMYAITLSIAKLKDNITFATTEETSRQEWIYVINHVINKLSSEEDENIVTSLLQSDSHEFSLKEPICFEQNTACKKTNNLHYNHSVKRNTWHAENDRGMKEVLNRLRVGGEEEMIDLDAPVSPTLAQEESFKELQEVRIIV